MMHLGRDTYTCDKCKHFRQDDSLQDIVESDDPGNLKECKCAYCTNATVTFNRGSSPPTERQLVEIVILGPLIAHLWEIEEVYELSDNPASEYRLRSLLPEAGGGTTYCHIRSSGKKISDRALEDLFRQQLENPHSEQVGT
jgi:hypothetical protein